MFEPEGSQPTSTLPHCLLLEAVHEQAHRYKRIGIMQLPDPNAELHGDDRSVADLDACWDEEHIFNASDVQVFEIE